MKVKKDYEGMGHITLEKGGERAIIKVGNTVIDVMHGYNNSKQVEPVAIVDIYKYTDKKDSRVLLRDGDDHNIVLCR